MLVSSKEGVVNLFWSAVLISFMLLLFIAAIVVAFDIGSLGSALVHLLRPNLVGG